MDCLNNLIGFTLDDCICFKGEFTERSRKSKSGLYISGDNGLAEFPPLKTFQSILNCGDILEDIFLTAESQAKREFKLSLFKELSNLYTTNNRFGNTVKVGNTTDASVMNISQSKAALVYTMKPLKGMKLELKQVQPYFNQNRTLEITVIQSYANSSNYTYVKEIGKFTINTVGLQTLDLDYDMPFTDEYGQPYTYLFVYDLTDGLKPKNNANTCNCGSSEAELHRQLFPSMTVGDDINNMPIANMGNIAGLLFYIESICHADGIVCSNYKKNPIVAGGIDVWFQYQISKNMMLQILKSGEVNRFTMLNIEMLYNDMNVLGGKNTANMKYIAQNMDVSNSSCWKCKPTDKNNPYYTERTGILI